MSKLLTFFFNRLQLSENRLGWLKAINPAGLRFWVTAILLSGAGIFAACTDASLVRARHQIAVGNYEAAHEYFASEATRYAKLSPHQRRVVLDGLCLSEYRIGAPGYPLRRQLHTCEQAVQQSGSESGTIYSEVARRERDALSKKIDASLMQHDIAGADEAILAYRATPGSDLRFAADRTRHLWTIVNREAIPPKASVTPSISQLSRQFRRERDMSNQQFRRWIEQNMTVDGDLMVSHIEIGKHTLALWMGDDDLAMAALNLDRLARVNNGWIARCHCNGLTKVALTESGLPAYVIRLDAASHQSEVLILDQP